MTSFVTRQARRLGPLAWRGLVAKPESRLSCAVWARHDLAARSHYSSQAVPVELVKQLRTRTGASVGKCRTALSEEGCDIEKAVEWLRHRGIKSMEKREATSDESLLALHVAADASSGAIVELKAETDFVTRGAVFQKFAVCLAETASRVGDADLLQVSLKDTSSRPEYLNADTTVEGALLETGSKVGERFVLGTVYPLQARGQCVVAGYVHPKDAESLKSTGRMASLVAIEGAGSCEPSRLNEVASRLARHIVAASPRFTSKQTVPQEIIVREREAFRAAHLEQMGHKKGKMDEKVMEKVLDGKMQRWYSETVLLCQEFIGPTDAAKPPPVAEWLETQARELGLERIVVEDFRLASL